MTCGNPHLPSRLPRIKNLQVQRGSLADSHNDVLVCSVDILFAQALGARSSDYRLNNLDNTIIFSQRLNDADIDIPQDNLFREDSS